VASNTTLRTEQFRFSWIDLAASTPSNEDRSDLTAGLSQSPKSIPCRFFYDDRGSQLFEQICDLPEYYPTRTEQAILAKNAEAIATLTGPCDLVELGSGSSRKTRLLLTAYGDRQSPLFYYPIDISAGILRDSAMNLLADYPDLQVCGLAGTYEQALAQLPRKGALPRLLMFLGSTLGNLDPQECETFLKQVTQSLLPGDYFLLGIDLQKSVAVIEAAYNDTQGVTAAFNLNILQHLNERFVGDFNLQQFEHVATYEPNRHQIEMYLRSTTTQTVELKALGMEINLAAGELIGTEISRKFECQPMITRLQSLGLTHRHTWTDFQQWFALILCQR
jgi:dimethylhistidine N-methyltransferase